MTLDPLTALTVHLRYDDLLRAVVDSQDLTDDQAGHLNECPKCKVALERLNQRYGRIGKMAAHLAPASSRTFRLPAGGSAATRSRFRPLWGLGLIAVVIVLFNMYGPYRANGPLPEQATLPTPASDLALILEVDALVHNALPARYREVAAVAEPRIDEDLINWVVPSIQDEEDVL